MNLRLESLLLVILALNVSHGFQFMKNWKMPTYDPYEEATKEKFGDKSAFDSAFAGLCDIVLDYDLLTLLMH
jgi:hypothetical protein